MTAQKEVPNLSVGYLAVTVFHENKVKYLLHP